MKNKRQPIPIIIVASLVAAAYSSHADASLDILNIKQHGQYCDDGFRPLTSDEVMPLKGELLKRMGHWQIINLADGYVVMGAGHFGRIKQDVLALNTWCTDVIQPDHSLPEYSPIILPGNSEAYTEWHLINDKKFYKPLALFAHYLGFAWAGGSASKFVGDDMVTSTDGNGSYHINANNGGPCEGYRCNERLKINISEIEYHIDPNTFSAGEIIQSDKEKIGQRTEVVINESDVKQQYRVTFSYDKTTNWSKTDTYGLSQRVSTKNTFEWPLVGKTELSIEVGANQSWASTTGDSQSKGISNTIVIDVPPHSKQEVSMEIFRSSISYPYQFNAALSYEVAFTGFMKWSGNALSDHPQDRPTYTSRWVIGRHGGKDKNIAYQYQHRNISSTDSEWDWPWLLRENDINDVKSVLGEILTPIHTHISGHFFAEASYGSNVRYGKTIPLYTLKSRVAEEHSMANSELSAVGIKNFKVNITPIPMI
ncbi:aerolysin family beta-barrel pore-forming toxin [Veronia pacifica]|uniref:Aerolysin-like C-terminal domain-containing protein n=1 Tax=Veronia pacifica TaxID=1080227 RepID=A0A1C3E513_9GAMM|nr:aerolysin family beta-barrel pore-forming toxin [Veronia pacifica]ODA28341.1 hypothetical protein A8L45_23150 [Veronia pacifica]